MSDISSPRLAEEGAEKNVAPIPACPIFGLSRAGANQSSWGVLLIAIQRGPSACASSLSGRWTFRTRPTSLLETWHNSANVPDSTISVVSSWRMAAAALHVHRGLDRTLYLHVKPGSWEREEATGSQRKLSKLGKGNQCEAVSQVTILPE